MPSEWTVAFSPKDQRTASAYIFSAICPTHGKGAGLVLPRCTTQAMSLQLAEIAQLSHPTPMPCFSSIEQG